MTETSVLVVGAGAIGGVAAAQLALAGRRVSVLDANEEHVALMRAPGLLINDLGTEQRIAIDAHTNPDELEGPFDFALVTLKAAHLESALGSLREKNLARVFVSLGNGLVQQRIAGIVGEERMLVGTVEWGATNLGPGHLARTTSAPFVIGEIDGSVRTRTRRLADALAPVAEVRLSDNIRGQIWSKLLVNSTFSGLGAVSGLLYREIVADTVGREAAFALWREGVEVGIAEGLELEEVVGVDPRDLIVCGPGDSLRADRALSVVMGHVGATKASMLQDLERGAKTEIDVINGAIVEKGREQGICTPMNTHVVKSVRTMEQGERRPSREALAEMRTSRDN